MACSWDWWGTVEDMVLWILGLLTLLLVVTAGLTLLKAGHDLDAADDSDAGAVAGLVDDRLHRARAAVETLVMPDVRPADLRPSADAHRNRAATYAMFGVGLIGIAAFVVVGLVLLGL
jgi:hypothetical protein